ncbi:MAG TPA: S8 family serine peptidase [Afifellaceae bacterium]|nr:S8 family serine peptidase [Afifellaceae bacterium]
MPRIGRIALIACAAALSAAALVENLQAQTSPGRIMRFDKPRVVVPPLVRRPLPEVVRPDRKKPQVTKAYPPDPIVDPKPPAKPPRRPQVADTPPPPPGFPNARPDFFPEQQANHPLALYLPGAFVPDIILVAFPAGTGEAQVDELAGDNDLTVEDRLLSNLLPFDIYRLRVGDNRQLHEVIDALGADQRLVSASPDFIYTAQGESGSASIQFAPQRMHVAEAHLIATGNAVKVAIIDTGIDGEHDELKGSVTASYDAVDADPDAPTRHGTAMAGVIASKSELTGIAPRVEILSARAFAPPKAGGGAAGTTFAIIKAMDWAYRSGARVYNLSFAGPKDPVLIRALDALAEYDTIMIGAAGNAGPGKPPAYPAAHPGVIAVTATDQNDGLYTMANRGSYVAVAAPGVDIITTTPGNRYELMSGTSIATAHITGVVALVLERHPNLKADAVSQLLANASIDLGQRGVDHEFGAGLVDAVLALKSGDAIAGIVTGGLTATD